MKVLTQRLDPSRMAQTLGGERAIAEGRRQLGVVAAGRHQGGELAEPHVGIGSCRPATPPSRATAAASTANGGTSRSSDPRSNSPPTAGRRIRALRGGRLPGPGPGRWERRRQKPPGAGGSRGVRGGSSPDGGAGCRSAFNCSTAERSDDRYPIAKASCSRSAGSRWVWAICHICRRCSTFLRNR